MEKEENVHLQSLDIWAESLNDTSTLMPQTHVNVQVVLIDEDLVAIEFVAVRGPLYHASSLRAFVEGETEAFGV